MFSYKSRSSAMSGAPELDVSAAGESAGDHVMDASVRDGRRSDASRTRHRRDGNVNPISADECDAETATPFECSAAGRKSQSATVPLAHRIGAVISFEIVEERDIEGFPQRTGCGYLIVDRHGKYITSGQLLTREQ